MKKFMKSILFGVVACSAIALVGCGETPANNNNVIYNNTGNVMDWVEPYQGSIVTDTDEGNQVLAIKGYAGYFPEEDFKTYTTDKYDFVITYDIKPISEILTGTTYTANGETSTNVVSVDVGIQAATYIHTCVVFGGASEGNVKVGFGPDGTFDGENGIQVAGDVWYTVTVTVTTTAEGKNVTAVVKNKATNEQIGTTSMEYKQENDAKTAPEYLYANIYHGGKENTTNLAYLDNFKVAANKR